MSRNVGNSCTSKCTDELAKEKGDPYLIENSQKKHVSGQCAHREWGVNLSNVGKWVLRSSEDKRQQVEFWT